MEQIPDAPWISEAERDGFPPYETADIDLAIKYLKAARRSLETTTDHLMATEDILTNAGDSSWIRDLISAIEDVDVDIIKKLRTLEED